MLGKTALSRGIQWVMLHSPHAHSFLDLIHYLFNHKVIINTVYTLHIVRIALSCLAVSRSGGHRSIRWPCALLRRLAPAGLGPEPAEPPVGPVALPLAPAAAPCVTLLCAGLLAGGLSGGHRSLRRPGVFSVTVGFRGSEYIYSLPSSLSPVQALQTHTLS